MKEYLNHANLTLLIIAMTLAVLSAFRGTFTAKGRAKERREGISLGVEYIVSLLPFIPIFWMGTVIDTNSWAHDTLGMRGVVLVLGYIAYLSPNLYKIPHAEERNQAFVGTAHIIALFFLFQKLRRPVWDEVRTKLIDNNLKTQQIAC
jgi:hypothetical protein